jgi:hypothetical protein
MVEILGLHGMRVEVDAAEIDRPHQAGGVAQHGFLSRGARGVLEFGDLDEVRALLRRSLLKDRFLGDALDEAFQDHRPTMDAAQRAVGDREVVIDQIELRDAQIVEHHLVRMCDGQLATVHLQR